MTAMSEGSGSRLPTEISPAPLARTGLKVDRKLLEILVCPLTKSALRYDPATQELISAAAYLAYPLRDGIPILLPDEAREIAR